jgi:hypothetical protein
LQKVIVSTDLKVAEERVHEEIQKDEGCKDGVQDAHEDEPPLQPVS